MLKMEAYDCISILAKRLQRRLPRCVEVGDLISDGYFGWRTAERQFDPKRGVPLHVFARTRVIGAMLDGLRQRDWLPPSLRKSQTPPSLTSVDEIPPVAAPTGRSEQRSFISACLPKLTPRQRLVLQLHYLEGLGLLKIAECFGISEARVCQLHRAALAQLRLTAHPPNPRIAKEIGQLHPKTNSPLPAG